MDTVVKFKMLRGVLNSNVKPLTESTILAVCHAPSTQSALELERLEVDIRSMGRGHAVHAVNQMNAPQLSAAHQELGPSPRFNLGDFFQSLKCQKFGQLVLFAVETPSTQTFLNESERKHLWKFLLIRAQTMV